MWPLLPTHCTYKGLLLHQVTHTENTTHGKTPLDEWSARRRDLYLKTHTTHNRHPCLPRGNRNHNPSKQAATVPRLRSRLQRNRSRETCLLKVCNSSGIVSTFSQTLVTQFWYLMWWNRLQSWSGAFVFLSDITLSAVLVDFSNYFRLVTNEWRPVFFSPKIIWLFGTTWSNE